MHYGLYVPPLGDYADARTLANLAKDAEDAGWDGFFTWDHVAFGWPERIVDPWIAYSAMAMNTHRIRFGPLVTPLPRRRPWKLARETVSLDRLSDGRLILGVGIGGGTKEFTDLGEKGNIKEWGAQLDEGLQVLNGLWSGEAFSFEGQYYHIHDACFQPAPLQQPRIPISVGGFWPGAAPFRRAAKWDGVFPLHHDQMQIMSPEGICEVLEIIRRERTSDAPFDVATSGFSSGANPDQAAETVAPYAAVGVTWWLENVNPWRFGWNQQGSWPVEAMRERILQGPPRL